MKKELVGKRDQNIVKGSFGENESEWKTFSPLLICLTSTHPPPQIYQKFTELHIVHFSIKKEFSCLHLMHGQYFSQGCGSNFCRDPDPSKHGSRSRAWI